MAWMSAVDLMVTAVLRRIDMPSVLFFLGILVAVAGLQRLVT